MAYGVRTKKGGGGFKSKHILLGMYIIATTVESDMAPQHSTPAHSTQRTGVQSMGVSEFMYVRPSVRPSVSLYSRRNGIVPTASSVRAHNLAETARLRLVHTHGIVPRSPRRGHEQPRFYFISLWFSLKQPSECLAAEARPRHPISSWTISSRGGRLPRMAVFFPRPVPQLKKCLPTYIPYMEDWFSHGTAGSGLRVLGTFISVPA